MGMKIQAAPFGEIDFGPDSSWRLQIARDGETVAFSLFWGDKQLPTHQALCTLAEFDEMAKAVGLV